MRKFKDACDKCGKFDYCAGHGDKVLCPTCAQQEEQDNGNSNES